MKIEKVKGQIYIFSDDETIENLQKDKCFSKVVIHYPKNKIEEIDFDLTDVKLEQIRKPTYNYELQGLPIDTAYNLDKLNEVSFHIHYEEKEKDKKLKKKNGNQYLDYIKKTFNMENQAVWNKSLTYEKKKFSKEDCEEIITYDTEKNPKYPIYVISKGRWEQRKTIKYLERIDVPYFVVVEESEYSKYAEVVDINKIIIFPNTIKQLYLDKGYEGGIPVRNFVYNHSKYIVKSKRHWILDDNINDYRMFYKSKRYKCYSKRVFTNVEDYTEQFDNVYLSGHNYQFFCISEFKQLVSYNTKIYSSILIHNELNEMLDCVDLWRGKYNEDVDLTIRTLKANLPTICFNCFASNKEQTMRDKGGNTDTIYAEEDYDLKKVNSLLEDHSDCVKVVERYNRRHHEVNYTKFSKIKLILREKMNDFVYNMIKVRVEDTEN